ncbi:MAG: alanine racemase [Planctomycetota bacterium]|nr:alanine racemase [Planctomycetota bacterium]
MRGLTHPSRHRSWLEIDLSALARNIRAFRRLIGPGRMLLACLKADAYGHGAEMSAKTAAAAGADRIGVATILEGERLRAAGVGVPIQVLGASFPEEIRAAVQYNLTLSLHDGDMAGLVAVEAAHLGRTVPVHLKIDSGMGRLGVLPENAVRVAGEIVAMPGLRLEGVFTHFADAADPEYSREQIRRFNAACADLESAGVTGLIRHAASSSAAILLPESRFDMVRIGAGVYGYLAPRSLQEVFPLDPVMIWRSPIIHLKDYPPGASLGYNMTFTTSRPTRIAVLPIGYADGYRRGYSNRAEVLIRGRRAPVVGLVSMDYTLVDVTGLDDLDIGCEATLLGPSGGGMITPEELAEWGDTIPYCVTTALGSRLERVYLE